MVAIKCKTCDVGTLTQRRVHRMSGIVVFIGYILLIPSVIGILTGVVMIVAGAGSGGSHPTNAAATGAAIAGGVGVFLIIASLVGGLLGWLLVMKKTVLKCDRCGATITAS
jgi:hypothetical protein